MEDQIIGLLTGFQAAEGFPETLKLGSLTIRRISSAEIEKLINDLPLALTDRDRTVWRKTTHAIFAVYSDENRKKMYRVPQLLRVIRPTEALVAVVGVQPPSLTLWSAHPTKIWFMKPYSDVDQIFTAEDAEKITSYYPAYERLSNHSGYHRLASACFFFETFYHSHQIRNSYTTIVTALEALFNTEHSEVAYKVQLRCAFFLRQEPQERERVFDDIKKIYKLRSSLVHGQSVGKAIYANPAVGVEYAVQAEEYVRECLQLILNNNYFDSFSLKDNDLAKKFDALVLGTSTTF